MPKERVVLQPKLKKSKKHEKLGQLTNMELHRADTEVRDIVDGKYDWRIERYENRNGLSR